MADVISVNALLAKNSLASMHNKTVFAHMIDRQLDKQYGTVNNANGFKTGSTISINRPARVKSTTGANLAIDADGNAITINDFVEDPVTFVVNNTYDRLKVAHEFDAEQLELELTNEKSRIGDPQGMQLANDLESKMLRECLVGVQCGEVAVGNATLGTPIGVLDMLEAQAYLDILTAPMEDRSFLIPPFTRAQLSRENATLFTPEQNSTIVTKGYIKEYAGADMYSYNMLPTLSVPALAGAGAVSANVLDGANSVGVTFGTQTGTKVFPAGTLLKFTANGRVNPETRESIGRDYTFASLADFTIPAGGGTVVITIDDSAKIYGPLDNGARQNIEALPVQTDVVTIVGAKDSGTDNTVTVFDQVLMFNKQAFTGVNLPLPKNVKGADVQRADYDGFSLRVVTQYAIGADDQTTRFDIWGRAMSQRPEYSYKILVPKS